MYNNSSLFEHKVLSKNASEKDIENYNKIAEECGYTAEVTEAEMQAFCDKLKPIYYKKHPEYFHLNEGPTDPSGAWWGVDPWRWIPKIHLPNLFAPLKWLAVPLAAGLGLLLAGLAKLFMLGKKAIAIARVRKWIESLAVLADSGYKKGRYNKDSLFLIRQRYRRDILQSAVKLGYAAGIDIPVKTDQPSVDTIESAKNENILDNQNKAVHEAYTTYSAPAPNFVSNNTSTSTNYSQNQTSGPSQFTSTNTDQVKASQQPKQPQMLKAKETPTQDRTEAGTINGQIIPSTDYLPDDDMIDWSLMSTIKQASWFGLKKKNVNFWKEAQSARRTWYIKDDKTRLKYVSFLISSVSSALGQITNNTIAAKYSKYLNDRIANYNSGNLADTKAGTANQAEWSTNQQPIQQYPKSRIIDTTDAAHAHDNQTSGNNFGMQYNSPREEYAKFKQALLENANSEFDFLLENNTNTTNTNIGIQTNIPQNQQNQQQVNQQVQNYSAYDKNGNWKRSLAQDTYGVMSQMFASSTYNLYNIYKLAYKTMNQFLQGLNNTVNVIIDQVAKVTQKINNGQTESWILSWIRGDGDVKQNQSLKNLWGTVVMPQLSQRAVVQAQNIIDSPEMEYFFEMVAFTIPACITQALTGKKEQKINLKPSRQINPNPKPFVIENLEPAVQESLEGAQKTESEKDKKAEEDGSENDNIQEPNSLEQQLGKEVSQKEQSEKAAEPEKKIIQQEQENIQDNTNRHFFGNLKLNNGYLFFDDIVSDETTKEHINNTQQGEPSLFEFMYIDKSKDPNSSTIPGTQQYVYYKLNPTGRTIKIDQNLIKILGNLYQVKGGQGGLKEGTYAVGSKDNNNNETIKGTEIGNYDNKVKVTLLKTKDGNVPQVAIKVDDLILLGQNNQLPSIEFSSKDLGKVLAGNAIIVSPNKNINNQINMQPANI